MRLLRLVIDEPLPGRVLPVISASHGAAEAARRYKAVVLTTMRQLRVLPDTLIEIRCRPDDAAEAVRFWLLPRLADRWQSVNGVFTSDGWQITFEPATLAPTITATGHILCPWLCARWVHTAMIGLDVGQTRAIGRSPDGETYFEAMATEHADTMAVRTLPPLPVIHSGADWLDALESPLGATLRKTWEKET